jgi:hypothetical protein
MTPLNQNLGGPMNHIQFRRNKESNFEIINFLYYVSDEFVSDGNK